MNSKIHRCGYCGQPTDKDGIPLEGEDRKRVIELLETYGDYRTHKEHGECCVYDEMMRQEQRPYVQVTRDMAKDGDPRNRRFLDKVVMKLDKRDIESRWLDLRSHNQQVGHYIDKNRYLKLTDDFLTLLEERKANTRNKLNPIKNLISIIESDSVEITFDNGRLKDIFNSEVEQVKQSIKDLSK